MSKKQDQARLKELQLKVWAYLVQKKMENEKDLRIPENAIESHRGRVHKALRLLREAGTIRPGGHRKTKDFYKNVIEQRVYDVLQIENSKPYEEAPTFRTTWKEYHQDAFFHIARTDYEVYQHLGYREISGMSPVSKIYVYWHQDDYYFTPHGVFPKAKEETRRKAILRAIAEDHFQQGFNRKLEDYLGLPANSFKNEGAYKLHIRNFAAYAASFTHEAYEGKHGFREEYEHFLKYFKGLLRQMDKVSQLLNEKGGHAVIVEEMRRRSIQELIESAPLNLQPQKDTLSADGPEKFRHPFISRFILQNTELFDYDILYKDDTSTEQLECYQTHPGKRSSAYSYHPSFEKKEGEEARREEQWSNYEFRPTDDELKIIKESEACIDTAKMISEICGSVFSNAGETKKMEMTRKS